MRAGRDLSKYCKYHMTPNRGRVPNEAQERPESDLKLKMTRFIASFNAKLGERTVCRTFAPRERVRMRLSIAFDIASQDTSHHSPWPCVGFSLLTHAPSGPHQRQGAHDPSTHSYNRNPRETRTQDAETLGKLERRTPKP
eukprot:3769626-Prymnesium_polylepis.2